MNEHIGKPINLGEMFGVMARLFTKGVEHDGMAGVATHAGITGYSMWM